jgi:hypothetical protein
LFCFVSLFVIPPLLAELAVRAVFELQLPTSHRFLPVQLATLQRLNVFTRGRSTIFHANIPVAHQQPYPN